MLEKKLFSDEKDYFIENIHDKILGPCCLTSILEKNSRRLLFRYRSFFVTPGIPYPTSTLLENMISSAGGTIERTRRSLRSIRESPNHSYFIISCLEDHYLYDDLSDIQNGMFLNMVCPCEN